MMGKTTPKERPIIFSTSMVQAILEGRKTQTRRVIKPQPTKPNYKLMILIDSTSRETSKHKGKLYWGGTKSPFDSDEAFFKCPYGQPGDLLYVRESFIKYPGPGNQYQVIFKTGDSGYDLLKWKPSIHMPKKYARIWLKITNIRVERVQYITEEDSFKEGIQSFTKDGVGYKYGLDGWNWSCQTGSPFMCNTAKIAFGTLWDSINGKPRKDGSDISWKANPWVWVVEFERVKPAAMETNPGQVNQDEAGI